MARVGQAAWQAVFTAPSAMGALDLSDSIRAEAMRWTQ